MNDKGIIVSCANVKAALTRIQTTPAMQGYLLGSEFALGLLPVLETLETNGKLDWSSLAKSLNERGLVTPAGKRWGPVTVGRLIGKLGDVIRISTWVRR